MEHSPQKGRKQSLFFIVVSAVLMAAVALMAFMRYFNQRNDELLYAERQSQMREVTLQLFAGLEDIVNSRWEVAHTKARAVKLRSPKTQDDLIDWLQYQDEVSGYEQQSYTYVVDTQG